MTYYPHITEKVCQQVRAGEIKFVACRAEFNPETGSKRPWEIIKTTACGKDFRSRSYADGEKAKAAAAETHIYLSNR